MTVPRELRKLGPVEPERPTAILLEQAVDLLFEMYLLRGDCSAAAQSLLKQRKVDEALVEDCARLDDTLSRSYKALQRTIRGIQRARARRQTAA